MSFGKVVWVNEVKAEWAKVILNWIGTWHKIIVQLESSCNYLLSLYLNIFLESYMWDANKESYIN